MKKISIYGWTDSHDFEAGRGRRPGAGAVPGARDELGMESQASVSDLPGAGAEPTHQAEKAHRSRETRAPGGARGHESGLVDG